jgi:upstream-binding transcription factor
VKVATLENLKTNVNRGRVVVSDWCEKNLLSAKMPKRRNLDSEEPSKRKRLRSVSDKEQNGDNVNLTKQAKKFQKENIRWSDSDILELLQKIEENIPRDDSLSHSSRLEKLNWANITVKTYSVKECQEVWTHLYRQVRKFRFLSEVVVDAKELVKAAKSTSAPKHPDRPKQPYNSFMFYMENKRQEVMKEYPTLAPNDVVRKMAQLFKKLPPQEREVYEEKAKAARLEYAEKMRVFYEKYPEVLKKRLGKGKSVQAEPGQGPPEKPKTPFELYAQVEAEKEESDELKLSVDHRELWEELPETDKMFWIRWAEERYAKYLKDLKEYLKVHPEYQPEKIRPVLSKKERMLKDRCSGRPQRPPRTAYHLFTKMMLESDKVQGLNSRHVVNYSAEKWKACTETEKREYKTRVEQMWTIYYARLEEYLMTLPAEERNRVREEENARRIESKTTKKASRGKLKKPQAPPTTEYKYFVSLYKGKEDPAQVWDGMADEEKKVYEEELQRERREYIKVYEEFLKSLSREELEKLGEGLGDRCTSSESDSATSEEESED